MTVRQMLMDRGRSAIPKSVRVHAARPLVGLNADVLGDGRSAAANGTEGPERVRSALRFIPVPKARAPWMAIVWAVCDALGQAGRRIALEWSQTDPATFDQAAFDNVWDSYRERDGGITAATLYKIARDNGWKDTRRDSKVASENRTDDDTPTDLALAGAYARLNAPTFRFDHAARKWLRYKAGAWGPCDREEQVEAFKQFAGHLLKLAGEEYAKEPDSARAKRVMASALRAQSANGIKAALSLAQSDPALAVRSEEFDQDADLFNVANGTIHLPSGKLFPHDPAQMLRRQSPIHFDSDAECPGWLRFMQQISCGDQEWIDYQQRACGYALSGHVSEEKIFFEFGEGRNGKSVFANLRRFIMGSYAAVGSPTLLMVSRREAGSATPELAMLVGVRLLLLNETEGGSRLSGMTLKIVASTEHISARPLYGSPFSFAPTHKVFMRGNHLPNVTETDEGTWRRIDLIPFDLKLSAEECDPELETTLRAEAPGILRWMVEGFAKWRRFGLKPPVRVQNASVGYRNASDVIGQWIDEQCETGPTCTAVKADAYARFRMWAHDEGLNQMSKKTLTRRLAERGVGTGRETTGARRELYAGLRLRP